MQSKSKQETKKPSTPKASTPKRELSAAPPAVPKAPTVPKKIDAVPMPEHGTHSHSYAAHLGSSTRSYTTPANFRQSAFIQLREPPQQMGRIGKQHRG